MNNSTDAHNATIVAWFKKYEGQIVPSSFTSGFTVLSYLVSFIGAWTTLELFNQRTAGRGVNNWNILLASSISMGGVSIWCMHFIGNRAIILVQGQAPLQIAYSAGYTTLSFFVPILVLLGAFMAIGSDETVSLVRVSLGGSLAGLAICGMHYLGQAGISNYTPIYQATNVVGSAIIAVLASIAALTVFFILRATWSGTWWKRGLCAVVLAGAVSGMHWVATVGTDYRLRAPDWSQINNNASSRDSTTIVVAVLSFSACIILLAFTIISQMRTSRTRNKAQMVVLASVIFDNEGRLLVTTEGNLPNEKITKQYVERSFDDVFGISHPVYLWLFRTTRNWPGISSLVPGMRSHLSMLSMGAQGSRPHSKTEISLTTNSGDPIEDYSIVFRELFCVAAADLADHLGVPLEELGVLYDEIISTGQMPRVRKRANKSKYTRSPSTSVDLERDGLAGFGRGQLLFLVRKVDRRQGEKLLSNGFRFAGLNNIIDILARSMRVEKSELAERMISMRDYVNSSNILDPGVHLTCFAIRANLGGVFDVLVRKDARNQLPTMQLPIGKLEEWQIDYLEPLEGKTVAVCLKVMKEKAELGSDREKDWAAQLWETLESLRSEIAESYFCDAKLISKPVDAPCRGFGEGSKPGVCKLIAFRMIVPINVRQPGPKLEFTPLKFLRMQQHVYPHSPDHAVWERKIYREFDPVMAMVREGVAAGTVAHASARHKKQSDQSGSGDSGAEPLNQPAGRALSSAGDPGGLNRRAAWQFWKANTRGGGAKSRGGSTRHSTKAIGGGNSTPVGGIMVSSAVTVDINDKEKAKARVCVPMAAAAPSAAAMVELSILRRKKEEPRKAPAEQAKPTMDDLDIMFGGVGDHGRAQGFDDRHAELGTVVEVVREVCDPETFVDELMHVTIDKRNS